MHGRRHAAPHLAHVASQHRARRPTTAASPARQPHASHCSPVHHASATCWHVSLPLDGALQLVPAARSTEPRTFQQRTLSSSKPPTRPAASATSPRKKQPHPWLCWSRGRSASRSGTTGAPVGTSWCAFGFVNHSPMATSWKTSVSRSYSLATAAGSWNEWSKES